MRARFTRRFTGGWATGPDDGYYFQHLAGHLLAAGKRSDLLNLLFDFNWLSGFLSCVNCAGGRRADMYSLLGDYERALAMALDYPDRVAGIILVSTGARLPMPASVLENGANPSTLPRAINAWQELSFDATSPEDQRDTFCRQLSQVRQTMLYGDWMACSRFDVTDRLGTIRKPTLVICGTADRLTPLALSRTLASHIPEAALQTVDRAGHMLIVEQPQRLAKLINVFLGTIPFTPGV